MQPPARTTRSTANPGLVDHPGSRRSNAIVTQEKVKKQRAAASRAEELHHRAAQVEEVEKEIRKAQAEELVRWGGRGKVTKKTFPCPSGSASVSFFDLNASPSYL
jgi:hypothetical protein